MTPLTDQEILLANNLGGIPGLEHGFGTRLSGSWPDRTRLATQKQIHSDCVNLATAPGRTGQGDALITDRRELLVGVRTADCVPLLLADPRRHVAAAVHAGWRGTVAEIASKTVQAMADHFRTDPADIRAAIGPCIGPCCFEVGPEVSVRFANLFPERDDLGKRCHVDLTEANRRQLLAGGLREEHISVNGQCTMCNATLFESFRRDGQESGRMISAIGWM